MPVQLSELDRTGDSDRDDYNSYDDYSYNDRRRNDGPISNEGEKDALLDKQRFKNRRRMAWIALISILIVTGLMMFVVPETRMGKLETVITWFYMSMATVVAAYMGATAYAYVGAARARRF